MRNASTNRLEQEARIAELGGLLATDRLTERQREAYAAELDSIVAPPPVTETLTINQQPAEISLLEGATLEPLVTETIGPDSAPIVFTPA